MGTKSPYCIVVFAFIILLPLAFTDPQGGGRSQQENRILAERPAVALLFQDPGKFIRQADAWISDNIGFREIMIAVRECIYTDILKSHHSVGAGAASQTIVIGEDGHYFKTGHNNLLMRKFQGERWLPDAWRQQLSMKLDEIGSFLKHKEIPFIFMLCADKESIYPEYFPKSVIRGPEPISLDVESHYIHENTEIDFFSMKERLLLEKDKYLVHPKTGDTMHCTETGAFFSYQELMKHINAYFPALWPFSTDDIQITHKYDGFTNDNVEIVPERRHGQITQSFPDGIRLLENSINGLPILLFLGDSYGNQLLEFLRHHFSKTICISFTEIGRLEELIDLYDPDVVLLQSAERSLPYFANTIIQESKLPAALGSPDATNYIH